jgi:hypothetical protein
MAQSRNQSPSLLAGGDILPSTFVKLSASADNTGLQAGANEAVIGISGVGTKEAPISGASTNHAEDGDPIELFGLGDICLLKAGSGGFTRGDRLKSDAAGAGVPMAGTGDNQNIGAVALESAAEGEFGRVQVVIVSIEPDSEAVTYFSDDQSLDFGTGQDASLLWSTGDASNHTFVVALDDTNQSLHITDQGAQATDWNVSANTHPNLYIHSNTTPATDYLRIGDHDGTTAVVDVVGGTTLAFKIAGTTEADLTAGVFNVLDGNVLWVGVEATPGTTAGQNWIGIEDGGVDPAGTLTNALAIYTPDAGDSLDFLHADGTTDSLGT